jgi:hypothetical protein
MRTPDTTMDMERIAANSAEKVVRQALAHGSVVLLLACTLALVNFWSQQVDSGILRFVTAAWAVLCGLGLSHIIHEWCHYAGAVIAGATVTVKARVHPLFFDFEFPENTRQQFLCLSLGGLVGNFLLLALVVFYPAANSIALTGLLAAILGQLVFVLMLELPVSLEVMRGKDPLEALTEHFGQGGPLFLRAAGGGIATGVLVFLLY